MWLVTGLSIPECLGDEAICHLPLIETQRLDYDSKNALAEASRCDSLIISSQQTPFYIKDILKALEPGKKVFVSGSKTLESIKRFYHGNFFLGSSSDQEGILEAILTHRPQSLFYPRAKIVRPFLKQALITSSFKLIELECYQTIQISEHKPLPDHITGIVFSAPSTIKAYRALYGMPPRCPIKVAGHVSAECAVDTFGHEYKELLQIYL
jgi:uroporphyrinogen-III synthase